MGLASSGQDNSVQGKSPRVDRLMPICYHFISGEYPPDSGGVADYTALLAQAVVDAGHVANVWCPGFADGPILEPGGVTVHRIAGRFGPAGLARLNNELGRFPGPVRILIQYTPHAFGWKAMNLPFAAWALLRRARWGDDVRVMFHEVAFPWGRRPLRHNVLAAVNRLMAAMLIMACTKAYVSIPGWGPLLGRLGTGRVPTVWTPIPSNVPGDAPPQAVRARRAELTGGCPTAVVVGHFGTYGPSVTKSLAPVLRVFLEQRSDVRLLLLGAGGDRWQWELIGRRADWSDRVVAPGSLPLAAIAEYLQACDLMIQPYPDGVSSRRTTIMAALANGVPIVTTVGPLSEPIWASSPVVTTPAGDVARLAERAAELLDSSDRRVELGDAGRRMYEERFALRHTLDALLMQ